MRANSLRNKRRMYLSTRMTRPSTSMETKEGMKGLEGSDKPDSDGPYCKK